MKQKDLMIIALLRQNARMPLTKMSRAIGVPVSTLFDRIKITEQAVITKHASLLNFSVLGYNARANVILKVDKQDKENLRAYLLKSAHINNMYKINNGFDFMIECVFKQINDLENFIEEIEKKFNVIELKSYFIIEDLRKEEFLNDHHLVE